MSSPRIHGSTGVLVVLVAVWLVGPTHVEPIYAWELFLDAGLGPSLMKPTVPDGTWYQQPFAHTFGTQSWAWRAGIGVRFNQQWSLTADYVRLGQAKVDARFVYDQDYDVARHRCLQHCDTLHALQARDQMQGPAVFVSYTFTSWPVRPFVKLGGMITRHEISVAAQRGGDGADIGTADKGIVPMGLIGGGVCYRWICAEVTYYKGLNPGSGFPISTEVVIPMMSLQAPLW